MTLAAACLMAAMPAALLSREACHALYAVIITRCAKRNALRVWFVYAYVVDAEQRYATKMRRAPLPRAPLFYKGAHC